ncbi:hypothetical protein FJZ19_00090 [Candidatus Pacearchaeota archaeon]|nr:hypothetical protein [Candidatus Pacearchaeota archaeon]
MYRQVEIGKRISGEALERILLDAAKDIGLNASSEDVYDTQFVLGSVREEKVYKRTKIQLRGRVLPLIEISEIKKKDTRSWFAVSTGVEFPPFGFASQRTVKKYLEAVSKRVEAA